MAHLRNLKTGEIREVDTSSKEFVDLKAERTDDNRFPLWEQTGQHDADPREDYEVRERGRWDAKVHDVTSDGVLQSGDQQLGGNGDVFARAADAESTPKASAKSK